MADQYWVLPVGGIAWEEEVFGTPVDQLPDTSGMVEIKFGTSSPQVCYPADPESGAELHCVVDEEVNVQVISSAEYSNEDLLWLAFAITVYSGEAAFDGNRVTIDISPDVMGFRYGSSDIMPPTARLYVAFDAPAAAGELRDTRSGSMGDGALRLNVDVYNPTPATINFRMFMASGTQPEFWTAFDDAAEIV